MPGGIGVSWGCLYLFQLYWGINNSFFTLKSFNWGFTTQSLRYDEFLFNKYVSKCTKLKYVILPISYNSLRFDLEDGPEWNIAKGYCIYMGCDYHKSEPKYNYELFGRFNIKMLGSVINTWKGKENHIGCDTLGYGLYYTLANRSDDWKQMGNGAAYHTIKSTKNVTANKVRVDNIIDSCSNRGIRVILLTTPTYKTYFENIDTIQYNEMVDYCEEKAYANANVIYCNYLKSSMFTENDFFDADHIDDLGAVKMTKMLDSIIMLWEKDDTIHVESVIN